MIGIYFSGTRDARYCVETLVSLLNVSAQRFPVEYAGVEGIITKHDSLVLRYLIQFSNAPFVVRDSIGRHHSLQNGKAILILNIMRLFSGDGTGCIMGPLKRYSATVLGGLQIKTPGSVCDSRFLKKNTEENGRIVREADRRIALVAEQIRQGNYPHEGLPMIAHFKGLFGQRLWFYRKTTRYIDQSKIGSACIGYSVCGEICPIGNIRMQSKRAISGNQCTMCYRCIGLCPKRVITLFGKQVTKQCHCEKHK